MQPSPLPRLAVVLACLLIACGGGDGLVPKVTPTLDPGNGGPAVARTPFTKGGRPVTQAAGPPPATATQQPPQAPPQTYTVVSGDTASGIASKLNVPSDRRDDWVRLLLTMNNTSPESLQVGQVLRLPAGATSAPPPGPTTAATRPAGTPPPPASQPVIVQLTSPVAREQEATLRVRAGANQGCSPTHLLPNGGVSGAAGLGPKTADAGGNLTWTFTVPANTPAGEGSIRVICAGNVVAAPLVVN